MTKRPLLRLKPREGRRARGGAPWIFSNEIAMNTAAKALAPGALVTLRRSGLIKVAAGMTTLEEVARETIH